ncbi:MAG: hypothetical protein IKJ41_04500 [Clostridia bacterium]|nr:hypothetical protein [Clostridia bacterium]
MKKILALFLAAALLFSFAACGKDDTTADTTTTTAADEIDTTAAPVEEDTTAALAEGDVTVAPVEGDTTAAPVEGETTVAEESTVPAAAPATAEEIVAYYNNAVNKAYAARVGFNKERYTDNEELNAGFLLKTFGDLVYSFMGIGAENKYTMDVTKGQWEDDVPHHYLRKSTLSTSDITSATCTESNGKYTIKFNVKPGNSKASKNESYNNSPIDKCGICVGDLDKSYFDHKTAPVIYAAVGQVVSGAVIEESYDNATIVAVIDVATGHLVSLTVEYDINVVIDVAGGGNATGSSHILYKNFKY